MQITNKVNTSGKFKTTNAIERKFLKELADLLEKHNAYIRSSEGIDVCVNGVRSQLSFSVKEKWHLEKISANTIRKALEKDKV